MKNPEYVIIVAGIIVFTAIVLYLVGKLRTSQKREEVSRKKIAAHLDLYEVTRLLMIHRNVAIPMLYESSNSSEIEQVAQALTMALIKEERTYHNEDERVLADSDWPDDEPDVDSVTYPRLIGNVLEVHEDHPPVVIRVVASPNNEDSEAYDEDID